ncbi:MAG TPA: peptide chain release factor N(5)-glutamine methyltransferase [Phycisphaerae bacterium]|nr:peptide chain release factor N(5)-glutamine methyltransferase [Phycisphaerae bacterium]HNU46112.1 peptide chain release factor N(5)-glutamine methyltransferase [Phycisphaerae bacterium]
MQDTTPSTRENEWTIGRLLNWTTDYLARHQVDEARLAGEVLLAHVLGCRRIELYTRFESQPAREQLDIYRDLVARAARQEPIAYLVGHKEFFSLDFVVTPEVLIPRPETETLAEEVIDYARRQAGRTWQILEVGTGTGCLAIAVLKHVPTAQVVATDRVPAALAVAADNARRHGVEQRLTLVEADGLALAADVVPAGGFDILMSNPPYISTEQLATLPPAVREYEPVAALTDGADGLALYRAIEADGARCLTADGAVFVEIAAGREANVRGVLEQSGRFRHRATIRDTVLGHERVMWFQRA